MICCEAVDPGTLGVFVTNEFNTIRNYSMGLLEHKHVTRLPLVVNNQNHIPALGHTAHTALWRIQLQTTAIIGQWQHVNIIYKVIKQIYAWCRSEQ